MSLAKRDLTFNFADRVIFIRVWSSDFVNFNIPNDTIRTTLDNTVQDVKELISQRSNEVGGSLNPKALRLIFRNREVNNYQPLSDFLVQEDHLRLQVEINKELLGSRNIRPTLLNVNLKLSSGRLISTRETLSSNIRSLKETIVDKLHLADGLNDIIKLEFNGGVQIDSDVLTLGELLRLDIAPLGDLNIYVTLRNDFECRLSCPIENALRTNRMAVQLTTTIRSIKDFILEQYTGSTNVQHRDLKVIYLGRLLTEETKLYEIIQRAPTGNPFILHFSISEPEFQNTSNGFWNDIKRGNFFEFLPREPNPNFEAEVQRDERLRDQLRDDPIDEVNSNPPPPILTQPEPFQSDSDDANDIYINHAPHLPNNTVLLGDSLEAALIDDERVFLKDVDVSATVYKIVIESVNGPLEVTLSSSQAIINDTDPANPYLMLSPSGMAKLKTLDPNITIPQIIIDSSEDFQTPGNINYLPFEGPQQDQPPHNHHHEIPAQPNDQQQQQQRAPLNGVGFNFNVDMNRIAGVFRGSVQSIYNLIKYIAIYYIFVESISNPLHKKLATFALVLYALTSSTNREFLVQLTELLPRGLQTQVTNFLQRPTGLTSEQIRDWFEMSLRRILNITTSNRIPHIIGSTLGAWFVDLLLLFTSFSPALHEIFLEIMNEREREREQGIQTVNEPIQEDPIVVNERVLDEPHDEPVGGAVLGTDEIDDTLVDANEEQEPLIQENEEHIVRIDGQGHVATGVEQYGI